MEDFRGFAEYRELREIKEIDGTFLQDYRAHQLDLISTKKSEGGISSITAKKRLQITKRFFEWLEELEVIEGFDRIPKVVASRNWAKIKLPARNPETFTTDEIQKLWPDAPKRMQLYILLGLNCGYKQADMASLKHEMIDWKAGFIKRFRHKTTTPQIHKLWPQTLELLGAEKSEGKRSELMLLSKNGIPLLLTVCTDHLTVAFVPEGE